MARYKIIWRAFDRQKHYVLDLNKKYIPVETTSLLDW